MRNVDRRQVIGATAALAYGYAAHSQASNAPGLASALTATGPHPSLGRHADTYGRFVGSWRGEYKLFRPEGTETGTIAVTFGWILEGRAIQDSGWTLAGLGPDEDGPGTTVRIYDPDIQAWRIFFIDPVRRSSAELVGRRVGDDVIHLGYSRVRERVLKWILTDVTRDSFTWRGHFLADDGDNWTLYGDYRFRRVT